MSEHSEHYHDTDRNKPLPGETVSSKEEVLQTLLESARGEITALAEANKLLAAQVAESRHQFKNFHRSLCARFGYSHDDKDWLRDLISLEEFIAAKVSARAADAPSEPSGAETDQLVGAMYALRCIANGEAIDPIGCAKLAVKVIDSIHSRAADALVSQPTEPWARTEDRLPPVETPVFILHSNDVKIGEIRWEHPSHEETFKSFMYWDDPNDDGQSWDWLEVTHWMPIPPAPASSQPTDGEVRNG